MSKEKEKPLNIYQRIHKVMEAVDYVQKSERRVNNQYRFVSHDQVTKIMHKHFVDHGIVMIPSVESYSAVQITVMAKGEKKDSTRTEATISVKFVNIDDPSDFIEAKYVGFGIDDSDKGIGKAMSYACKYAMLKVFCLETGEADVEEDQETRQVNTPSNRQEDSEEYISKNQVEELIKLFEKMSPDSRKALKSGIEARFKSPNFAKIPKESFDKIKQHMSEEIETKEEVLNEQVG
jgi:hypothetical protein